MSFNPKKIRPDFPNLKIKIRGKPLVYLDNAATTLKPQCVINAIEKYYKSGTSNVHRGVHYLSEQATAAFEESREKVRQFLNAKETHEIIFTRGTTESINLAAYSYGRHFLKRKDEIVISAMEHHSNIVPWQILCQEKGCILKIAPMNKNGELIFEEFEKILSPRTKLVSMVYVSNSLGTINPIKRVIERAHEKGIPVLVDAAQAVGHIPIDVQDLDCDFLAFSGHKLFGPTGVGIFYGKEKFLEKMPPFLSGGDMIASVTFEKTTYNVLPYKFEAGTPNVADVIGLGAAIDYLQKLDWNHVLKHEKTLLAYGTKILRGISGLKFIGKAKEKIAIFSFILSGIHPHDIGTLVDQEGIAIRTGHHCTQPIMKFFNVPATCRASLAFYNTKEELDKLTTALKKTRKVFK